jgi:hypothetical protein
MAENVYETTIRQTLQHARELRDTARETVASARAVTARARAIQARIHARRETDRGGGARKD